MDQNELIAFLKDNLKLVIEEESVMYSQYHHYIFKLKLCGEEISSDTLYVDI